MEKIEIRIDGKEIINMHIVKSTTHSYGFYNEIWSNVTFCTPKSLKILLVKIRDNRSIVEFIIEALKTISDYEMNQDGNK